MDNTTRLFLERTYKEYNCRRYVSPDPLQFLYAYEQVRDREIAALVAGLLAYGRVRQIIKSVSGVLCLMGCSPSAFLTDTSHAGLKRICAGFRHRFATGSELGLLLCAMKNVISSYGSLYGCFRASMGADDTTVIPALKRFVNMLRGSVAGLDCHLLPCPGKGSACKRLHLFLRWMVRSDDVDPGGWEAIPAGALIVPLDTHMFRIGSALGFTARKQADVKAALEITRGFRRFSPGDPVKYDFALTRFGIRDELALQTILRRIPHRC